MGKGKGRFPFVALLAFVSIGLGLEPKVSVGLKFTNFYLRDRYTAYDPECFFFNYTVWYEPYVGVSGELLISFIKDLSLRLELTEFRIYCYRDSLPEDGGQRVQFFEDLDADIIYILPLGRRFRPLVYGGLSYSRYFNKPLNDIRAVDPVYEIRLGPGLNYQIQKRINAFCEFQLFTWYQTPSERLIGFLDVAVGTTAYILGLPRINLGLRYTF